MSAAAPPVLARAERRLLIGALGFLTFSTVYAGLVMAPVLEQIADEFDVTTGTAGLVAAAYGLPGVFFAILAGPFSDRYGRKRFLVAGALLMGTFTALAAAMPSFEMLLLSRAVAGIGTSVIFPNVNATVADSFPYRERGRAVSTVIGLNTLASIAGLPLAGIVAEATSWRVSVGAVGVLSIVAGLALTRLLRPDRPEGAIDPIRELFGHVLRKSSAVAAIVSSLLGALFWFTWITYLVVFFQRTFALSQGVASIVSLTMGLGVLIGSQLGGRLGDRIGHRHIVAGTIFISSFLLLALTNVPMPLVAATLLNLLLSAVIGARFTTNTVLLGEQVPRARGTMLAVSSSVVSLGIAFGATIGGFLIDVYGFWALGMFCATLGVTSTAIVLLFVTEEPIDLETQAA